MEWEDTVNNDIVKWEIVPPNTGNGKHPPSINELLGPTNTALTEN